RGRGRPGADRAGGRAPGAQRDAGHARRRTAPRLGGRGGRRFAQAGGLRQRPRDRARGARADLRPVLLHQGRGLREGRGSRPLDLAQHRRSAPRPDSRRERRGSRRDVHRSAACGLRAGAPQLGGMMTEPDRRELLEEAEPLAPGLIHEMRHPLMGLLAGLELLARRIPAVSGTQEWQLLNEQAARMDELLRTYHDLVAGGRVQKIPFAVDETVRRAVSLLSPRIRKLGARFSLEAGTGSAIALGAPPLLVHAVTNLVVNALDAVEERGAPGRVQVRVLNES